MQILPSIELQPFIKHYLFLESEGKAVKKLRLFSDGNTGIVFSFRSNLFSNGKNNELEILPNSFLYGQISKFKDLYLVDTISLIVVVFQPAGINKLIGISADELLDNIIRIEYLFGRHGLQLQEKLFEEVNFQNKLDLLNFFFRELIAKNTLSNQSLIVQASLDFILKNKGHISINQLVKYTGYTERHIERKFIEAVGLSPKKFSNIIKLHSFLKYLKEEHKNFTTLAYEVGYADQSHLIKEFKKYTGITPTEYVHNTSKLAINFMELDASITESKMSGLYNF